MATCKICGKKGLFLKLNASGQCEKCQKILASVGYYKIEKEINHQQELLSNVWAAREAYKQDGDLDKLIQVYEEALIKSPDPLQSDAHTMYLAELYIKAGYNNKAWGYLNRILPNNKHLIYKIRFAQCKILKKEKKYSDAMEMLMLGYLDKSKADNSLQREMFIKDATPISNKLKWSPDITNQLASIIEKQVKQKKYSEQMLVETYRNTTLKN